MTFDEVADELRIGRTTVYGLVNSGELLSVRMGRSRRVRRCDLIAYVEHLAMGDGNDAA